MSITISSSGSVKNTELFLKNIKNRKYLEDLDFYGKLGVMALEMATPRDTGKTASSWRYDIFEENGKLSLSWSNTNVSDGWANVAVLIQYGHMTGAGVWIEGIDYINPALKPVFEAILENLKKKLVK